MTTSEANEIIVWMSGLFPSMTKDQAVFWREKIGHYQKDDVKNAIRRHHEKSMDGFIKPAQLIEAIHAETRRRVSDKWTEKKTEDERARCYWEKIESYIASLSDEELAKAAEEVRMQFKSDAWTYIASRPFRKSSILKTAIYRNRVELANVNWDEVLK